MNLFALAHIYLTAGCRKRSADLGIIEFVIKIRQLYLSFTITLLGYLKIQCTIIGRISGGCYFNHSFCRLNPITENYFIIQTLNDSNRSNLVFLILLDIDCW
ncbi:hypothetical protein D3C80_1500990 [compost metagenome]